MIGKAHVLTSSIFGIINVTLTDFPEGATLSIDNTQNVLKQKVTETGCIFYVKKAGTYTLTVLSSGGVAIRSKTCEITTKGEELQLTIGYLLLLIDGTYINPIAGSWNGIPMGWSGTSDSGMTPYRSGSDPYLIVEGSTFSGKSSYGIWTHWPYGGAANANKIDLSDYNYIVMEYNLTGKGTSAGNYRKAFTSIMVYTGGTMWPTQMSQSSMNKITNSAAATVGNDNGVWCKPGETKSNLKMTLDMNSMTVAQKSSLFVSIGINGSNDTCAARVTIKKLYATNDPN